MTIPKPIIKFLDKHGVKYDVVEHKTVFTAYDLAQTLKKELKEIAKTLALKADKQYILIVLPASHKADLTKLKKLLKVKKLEILKEKKLADIFKMKPGTIAPFAKFLGIPVYLDKSLLKNKLIIASSGSYSKKVQMKIKDYLLTGAEVVGSFGQPQKFKVQKKTPPKKKKKRVAKKADAKKSVRKPAPAKASAGKKKPVKKTGVKKKSAARKVIREKKK